MLVSAHPGGTGFSVNVLYLSLAVMMKVLHCMSFSWKGFGGYRKVKVLLSGVVQLFAPVKLNDVPHGSGEGIVCLQIVVVTWARTCCGTTTVASANAHPKSKTPEIRLRKRNA